MKIKDLIKGDIYKQCRNGNTYIFEYQVNNESKIGYAYYILKNYFSKCSVNTNNGSNFSQVQEATPLEKAHLLECIKQNKFVPLENIKLPQIDWLWTV